VAALVIAPTELHHAEADEDRLDCTEATERQQAKADDRDPAEQEQANEHEHGRRGSDEASGNGAFAVIHDYSPPGSAGTGGLVKTSDGSGTAWCGCSLSGEYQRWAIAVGTIAEITTTVTSSENWVRSMMCAFRP
jgi:hypothetical protein